MTPTPVNISVAQLGARMNYAVPRIFSATGHLNTLFTDISLPKAMSASLTWLPDFLAPESVRRLATRQISDVPPNQVRSMPWFGIDYWRRHRRSRTPSGQTATYLWGGREFCRLILRCGLGACNTVYTFNSAGLELLRFAKQNGKFAVMEQTIAPKFLEQKFMEEEVALWPNWENAHQHDTHAQEYAERERDEWRTSDLIVCGSEFVASGVRQCSEGAVPVCVVPYGVDPPAPQQRLPARGHALRVLFCGTVGLRKGVQYLLRAAARLNSPRFEFRVVGPVNLRSPAVEDLRSSVELFGGVPRSEMSGHYGWADVFVLPSLCEGSATVCYEALASGLPVITTPNAGSVVRDGIDGFIVPIRDAEAIAARLEMLISDPRILDQMSGNAALRAAEFTVKKYGERLLSTVQSGLFNRT